MANPSNELLSEIARRLRCVCSNTGSAANIIVENYQPLDCDGDPVGDPISVMPVISVAKQDMNICNYQQIADAINGGDVAAYDIPVIETASAAWLLSTNNDITKVHSISISVVGTAGGTVSLTIGAGSAKILPVGYTYSSTATTTFGVEFAVDTYTGGATIIISILKSA